MVDAASQDKFLIVRDLTTGRPIAIPTSIIPEEIRPSEWFENPYWMYRPDRGILEPLMKAYLKHEDLLPHDVKFLARYMVDYACHIAVMGYLFAGGPETLPFNLECIRKLREIESRAKTRADLNEMINVGMDYELDSL